MDKKLREEIKQSLKNSLRKYVTNFEYGHIHPLDLLIPKERKIRSIVGGLETSMGTTVWEPIARSLAKKNGFEIINEKILKPEPIPHELAMELSTLVTLRESKATWISTDECVERLRNVCKKINRRGIQYVPPAAGTGVDIRIKKDEREYAFDTKTVQPNLGSIKSFNRELLEWYAYSMCKNPDINITCQMAYPYNPYKKDFWTYSPHNRGILKPGVDAVVENEFWDFISGMKSTYQQIILIFSELNDEGFGKELSKFIERVHTPST